MAKYRIFAGMSGGFNDIRMIGIEEHKTEEKAVESAYQRAFDEFESYAGLHGVRDRDQIAEEEGLNPEEDEEIIEEYYRDEMESWTSYYVERVDDTP